MIDRVPRNFRRAALAAFVQEIQGSDPFRNERIIKAKSFRTWNGQGITAEPTVDMMPALQIRWLAGEAHRVASTRPLGGAATSATEIRPSVAIELWTRGTDQNDILDLADLIYDVLAPQDQTARKAMQTRLGAVGIRDWRLAKEIAPPALESYSQTSIYAVGSYELTLFLAS